MSAKSEVMLNKKLVVEHIISGLFGTAVLVAGLLNTFWGNDLFFGIFLVLLSFVYFLPVNIILSQMTGLSIPGMGIVKIVLGIFIIWVVLGVGELYDKIDLMKMDLRYLGQ
jgi:hypothetical protein